MPLADCTTKLHVKLPFFNRAKFLTYQAKLKGSASKHALPNFTVKLTGNLTHALQNAIPIQRQGPRAFLTLTETSK